MDKKHSIYADLKKPKRFEFPIIERVTPVLPIDSKAMGEDAVRCLNSVLEHIAELIRQDEQD